jgi:ubiquinone/menaquinone biosynthesis C-methylase UbiE
MDLYRQIALLSDLDEEAEVLDVACGKGVSLEYFVREHGVRGSGVDEDARLIAEAEQRAKDEELGNRLQFQAAPSDSLPYRDEIFDIAMGEIGLAAHCSPADAVRELVRVTKPGGVVVLVQLVWKARVDEARARVLSEHLGARPLMMVEWKRLLREAGVENLHTEDWTSDETSFQPRLAKPFPDFAEIFSLFEKVGILRRAWSRWGWRGVRTVLEREREVHRLLTRERILGLDLIKGRKKGAEAVESTDEGAAASETTEPGASAPDSTPEPPRPSSGDRSPRTPTPGRAEDDRGGQEEDSGETAGLPLFGGDERGS